jgi:hypothetical protein
MACASCRPNGTAEESRRSRSAAPPAVASRIPGGYSRLPPSDDIGRKRETPMNSTPDPKEIKPRDALIAGADEGLTHAHEQIKRADEQLTRLTEQLARMERDDARPPSARLGSQGLGSQGLGSPEPGPHGPSLRPPPGGRPALLTLVGLSLAACITVVALLVLLLSYGDGPTLIVARWAPQPVPTPSLPPENLPSPAQPAPSTVQVAAVEPAPAQATPPQAATLAQAAPQDAAPAAPAALPDQTQLLQTIARDLANLERTIEQLKANQQQMAGDNSKAIGELKASQEEIKRVLAKVSEQSPPKTSPPQTRPAPTQPAPTLRKPERTRQSSQARARPRYRREWIYDDDW